MYKKIIPVIMVALILTGCNKTKTANIESSTDINLSSSNYQENPGCEEVINYPNDFNDEITNNNDSKDTSNENIYPEYDNGYNDSNNPERKVFSEDAFYDKLNDGCMTGYALDSDITTYRLNEDFFDKRINNEEDARSFINYISPVYTGKDEYIDIAGDAEIEEGDRGYYENTMTYTLSPIIINGYVIEGHYITIGVNKDTRHIDYISIPNRGREAYNLAVNNPDKKLTINDMEAINTAEKYLHNKGLDDETLSYTARKSIYTYNISEYNLPLCYIVTINDNHGRNKYIFHIGASNYITNVTGKILLQKYCD